MREEEILLTYTTNLARPQTTEVPVKKETRLFPNRSRCKYHDTSGQILSKKKGVYFLPHIWKGSRIQPQPPTNLSTKEIINIFLLWLICTKGEAMFEYSYYFDYVKIPTLLSSWFRKK